MTNLYVLNGPDEGKSITLKDSGAYVGRGLECDLRLEDGTVSRKHLKIIKKDNKYFITDLKSQNGTLYNGTTVPPGVLVQIEEEEPIAIGMSIIGLGDKCVERIMPVIESVGLTTQIAEDSGIFQVHRAKTNQKKLRLLYKVSELLDRNLQVNKTLEKILDYIFDLLKVVDTGAFILVEPRTEQILDVVSKPGMPDDDRSTVYCPDVVRQTIQERQPVTISNVETENKVDRKDTLKILKIQSVLCAPLISHSYLMGVVYIDSKRTLFAFNKEDISLFVDLCKRIAQFLMQAHGAFESTTIMEGFHPDGPPPS
jgi:pSer/pThr/pTyr-binding forkhead associated (FHA) protein